MEKQDNKKAASVRDSNMELVRIIAMSMIAIVHFYGHGGLKQSGMTIVPALTMYGVDLFILISGAYLIKVRWKSIIRLALMVLAFNMLSLMCGLLYPEGIDLGSSMSKIRMILAPLSGAGLWFIEIYFILMILSPLINAGLRSWSLPQLRIFIFLVSLVEFYSCFLMSNRVDVGGYSLFNFLYVYVLGYYLMREEWIKHIGVGMLTAIIVMGVAINFLLANGNSLTKSLLYYSYSSPVTIAVSAAIMLMASRKRMKSKVINSIAAASLGVYLLQDGLFGNKVIYPFQQKIASQGDWLTYVLISLAIFVGFWVVSWLVMRILELFVPQLSQWLASKLQHICSLEHISGTDSSINDR